MSLAVVMMVVMVMLPFVAAMALQNIFDFLIVFDLSCE